MIYVVLRDGRVLEYNNAMRMVSRNGMIELSTKDDKYYVALIPADIVERAEPAKPCRISKEYKKKKYPRY